MLVVLGAVTLAVITVLRQLELIDIADSFFPDVARGERDLEQAAEDYIEDELSPALQGISLGGSIALAFATIMIALNAMRAGLLSRFMGILGIFVGVVLVIPLGVQILQLFWFAALGMLFLGRWPGGRGPAWETGEAIPWPGAGQQREEMEPAEARGRARRAGARRAGARSGRRRASAVRSAAEASGADELVGRHRPAEVVALGHVHAAVARRRDSVSSSPTYSAIVRFPSPCAMSATACTTSWSVRFAGSEWMKSPSIFR